ncbi:MAG TPA: hypothetical protein VF346_01965 [Bacteroidales bacterium]
MTHTISYRRMLSRMGYYNYQNGLIYHHINQEGGWENHQEHCRSIIIKALELFKPEKVTVLGSGWLLDLPLAEIIERTQKVFLVDIVHPPDVINQVERFENVELIEQDVTGGLIEEVWLKGRKHGLFNKLRSLENIKVHEFKPDFDTGMIISLNILTQLESLPVDFIKKRSKIKEEDINLFRAEIQKKHIDFLMRNRSVLISDYAEVITSRAGDIKTIPTLLTDLPACRFSEKWTWNFDQTGADLYNSRSQFKIVALIN